MDSQPRATVGEVGDVWTGAISLWRIPVNARGARSAGSTPAEESQALQQHVVAGTLWRGRSGELSSPALHQHACLQNDLRTQLAAACRYREIRKCVSRHAIAR